MSEPFKRGKEKSKVGDKLLTCWRVNNFHDIVLAVLLYSPIKGNFRKFPKSIKSHLSIKRRRITSMAAILCFECQLTWWGPMSSGVLDPPLAQLHLSRSVRGMLKIKKKKEKKFPYQKGRFFKPSHQRAIKEKVGDPKMSMSSTPAWNLSLFHHPNPVLKFNIC